MTAESGKSRKKEEAIAALLVHPTITGAAKAAGVSEASLLRWLKEDAFANDYRTARRQAVEVAIGLLVNHPPRICHELLLLTRPKILTPSTTPCRSTRSRHEHTFPFGTSGNAGAVPADARRPICRRHRRAEIARQRLPDCTDLEETLGLIQGLPSEVYITLLRLVPEAMLFAMHDVAFRHYLFETLTYGYTGEELRELPVSELLQLHRDNLGQVEKHRERYR